MQAIILVGVGGAFGAITRWVMIQNLNLSVGVVNILGGYLIGFFMMALMSTSPYKLLLITGFLGSFTTFSAFSFATFELINQGKYISALATIAINVFGSIIATALGVLSASLLKGS